MTLIHSNNFSTTLNGNITNAQTTMIMTSVTGAPTVGSGVNCNFTITDGTNYEIVQATSLSTLTYTIVRAQENTTGRAWSSGATVTINSTAASFDSKLDGPTSLANYAVVCGPTTAGGVTQQVSGLGTSTYVLTSNGAAALPTWQAASGGGITVTGTTSRIAVTGGGGSTPTIDIDAAYVGQSSITTLGTVGTGTWSATAVGPTKGGTGLTSFLANSVLYASAGNTWSTTSSVNNAVLGTSSGGVPSFVTTLPSTVQTNITSVGTVTAGTWSATTIAIAKGGTGVTSVTAAPTASSFAGWDANKNISSNSFIGGYTTTSTAAGTTTLVVGSTQQQYFTGSTTQTVLMPVTSTLVLGQTWNIINNSTGVVTVQSSGANNIIAMPANTAVIITCILITGTTAASWTFQLQTTSSSVTGTGLSVLQTSPTLITPVLGTPASGVLTNCTGLPVAGGGTGIATTTPYSVICAGTTSTGNFQSLAALGGAGSRLQSAGSGALPSFKGGLTAFAAARSSAQTLASSTITKVQFATEIFDTGSYYDNVTNYRFTPLIAGYYVIDVQLTFTNVFTANTLASVYIYKNGVAYAQTFTYSSVANQYVGLSMCVVVHCNGSTDYIEGYAVQYDSVSRDLYAPNNINNYISGCLLEAD